MVVGSSVSRKPCDKVFLSGHIWSLDRQCHGEHVTVFLNGHIWSLDRQCHGEHVTKFS